jgi:DNA replication protein DnaC
VTLSRVGVELLFRVFGDRYERASVLITSDLPFGEWNQIFQGERMTAALLDRLCHHCQIFEMNGESYRFRESMKQKKGKKPEHKANLPFLPGTAIFKDQVGQF